jgi:hypothetical protein
MTMFDEDILGDLLRRSTDDLHAPGGVAGHIVTRRRHHHRRVVAVSAVSGAVALAAAGIAIASPGTKGPDLHQATGGGKESILYQLASASAAAPALQGRYVILSETDTDSQAGGETKRTSVIDTETGASTTYQAAFPVNGTPPGAEYAGIPPVLTEGPESDSTAAYYAGLPTDPTQLRSSLLAIADQQAAAAAAAQQQAQAQARQQAAQHGQATPTDTFTPSSPGLTDDDNVFQEADQMLWSPLVSPALRSALYKVLAATPGVTVNPDATDPAGQAAIAMSRTYSGITETDTTYEDPATGAVLAQVWDNTGNPGDVLTAVYQPVTSSDTIPPNPYAGRSSG